MELDSKYLLQRLDTIEAKLMQVLVALDQTETDQWITTSKACQLMSISDKHLMRLIATGVIHGPAIRNVGTVKRPRYRYHHRHLLSQWLKRVS